MRKFVVVVSIATLLGLAAVKLCFPGVGSAQDKPAAPSLYDCLGGRYLVSAVVDDFIDRVYANATLNANPAIGNTRNAMRKPGLKVHVATDIYIPSMIYRSIFGWPPARDAQQEGCIAMAESLFILDNAPYAERSYIMTKDVAMELRTDFARREGGPTGRQGVMPVLTVRACCCPNESTGIIRPGRPS